MNEINSFDELETVDFYETPTYNYSQDPQEYGALLVEDFQNEQDVAAYIDKNKITASANEIGYWNVTKEGRLIVQGVAKRLTRLVEAISDPLQTPCYKGSRDVNEGSLLELVRTRKSAIVKATSSYGELFDGLEANDLYGPLNVAQKLFIRDNLQHVPNNEIAKYVNTHPQNVYNAKKVPFKVDKTDTNKYRNSTKVGGHLYSNKYLAKMLKEIVATVPEAANVFAMEVRNG